MPKGDGSLEMVLESLKILINSNDEWISNEIFKEKMSNYLIDSGKKGKNDHIDEPYLLKKSEIARYFGFIEHDFKKKGSKITESGKKFLNYKEKRVDILFENLTNWNITFGRNNSASKTSDSDLEVPILILKLLLAFGKLSKNEISISIFLINEKGLTFLEVISELLKIKNNNKIDNYLKELEARNLLNKYKDLKILVFYKELSIVKAVSNDEYSLNDSIKEKYKILINNFYEVKNENYFNKRIYYLESSSKNLPLKKITNLPYQKIIYGAPGTGKSYSLNQQVEEYFGNNKKRVTFYDGYTYGQFVGMYKPTLIEGNDIGYSYVPGPFMQQLVQSLKNSEENFCLVIEEINRAKADKVFGNIFQLLDRDNSGKSRYPVSISEEQLKFLEIELKDREDILEEIKEKGLYIPNNLYIWATMNSADEGVQPLDTAFKRRWKFEYISLNKNEKEFEKQRENIKLIVGQNKIYNLEWNTFRKTINNKLQEYNITEDRLISPFFISPNDFTILVSEDTYALDKNIFVEKVLMYIFDDLLRHYPKIRNEIFKDNMKTFSKIYEALSNDNSELDDYYKKLNIILSENLFPELFKEEENVSKK